MKLNLLKTMVFAAILAVPFLGCEEADTVSSSSVVSSSSQIVAGQEFPYLRCNATGWDVNEATKLVPTDDPDIYVLEYTVTQEWMVSGFDQCILTITNSASGWGTYQQFIGTASSATINVPGTWSLDEGSQIYAAVSYPALGDYRATVDFLEMTVTFEPVDTTPPPADDVYYYLRCNTTGWNVGPNNRLVLDELTGLYTLDYAVDGPRIVAWGDICVLTQTNEVDGWGTSQVQLGIVPGSGRIVIPEDGEDSAAMIEDGAYFGVKYPAVGDYFAEFDPETGTLTLGVPGDDPIDWGLNGVVEEIGDGRVRITYDFETAEQVNDWLPPNPDEASATIEDGRLIVSGSAYFSAALLIRELRVDYLTYEAEIVAGNHINIYLGIEWDDSWNPAVGYGLVHLTGGKFYTENGTQTLLGGTHAVVGQLYQGEIIAASDRITWTVDEETFEIPLEYSSDVTGSLSVGGYNSTVAFDNLVIEAELAPLVE